jgi:hypothetical protein
MSTFSITQSNTKVFQLTKLDWGRNWQLYNYFVDGADGNWSFGLATAAAAAGPWTKFGVTPIITIATLGVGNPEMPRVGQQIIKNNGNYYLYCQTVGNPGTYIRWYSSDLHTWTLDGTTLDSRQVHGIAVSYTDNALIEFKGKSYMFVCVGNGPGPHMDCVIDNRTMAEMLALTTI